MTSENEINEEVLNIQQLRAKYAHNTLLANCKNSKHTEDTTKEEPILSDLLVS
jgi:hypothetical protein